jgi:DNA invertase Pin-like site-specific DNA recombinase
MRVYSYLRFSAAKQATGSSIERQADYARKWAAENGMVLDESLSMRDEGLSAYHQKHIKSGALGVFLEAVNAGKIPTGSILLVEGLDRLSRAEPITAQAQLAQIISAGITVVTATDGKQYNRDRLKANPMDLVYSLLVMIRAHEESETKSKRVSAAVRRKCEAWVAGAYRGKVLGGKDPSWVKWNGSSFELLPAMSNAIRLAISYYVAGFGPVRILQELADAGLEITGSGRASNIDHLITFNPSLYVGDRTVKSGGLQYVLKGYYPPLLSGTEYAGLLLAIAGRKQKPRAAGGKSDYPSLFTGLRVADCGHCGAKIVSQNWTRPTLTGSTVYRRFNCPDCDLAASKLRKAERRGSCPARPIEHAVLTFCSDQFNLDELTTCVDSTATSLRAEKLSVSARVAVLTTNIGKVMDAAFESDAALPQAMLNRMRAMEVELEQAKARELQIENELLAAPRVVSGESAAEWSRLKNRVLDLDYEARLKCRQMIAETFSEISVYFRGALPGTPENVIDVVLKSAAGVVRWLRIDRKTGELVTGLERIPQGENNVPLQ